MIDRATRQAIANRVLEMNSRRWNKREAYLGDVPVSLREGETNPHLQLPSVDELLQMQRSEGVL